RRSVFQAASVSKLVAVLGVLKMVQLKNLDTEERVSYLLRTWQLNGRPCAPQSWLDGVNLRRLMQYRGGIIGECTTFPHDACSNFDDGGGGFDGYEDKAGVVLPTINQILDGAPKSIVNSPAIGVSYEPDSKRSYSGAGFVLMQKVIE